MATAVSTTAVESTASVSATAVESSASMSTTAVETATSAVEATAAAKAARRTSAEPAVSKSTRSAADEPSPTGKATPSDKAATAEAPAITASAVETTSVEAASVAAEPRPSPNEDAVHEVIRAPIAVRRTIIRSVVIVAVGADWRRAVVSAIVRRAAEAHAYSDLSIRIGGDKKQKPKQSNIF